MKPLDLSNPELDYIVVNSFNGGIKTISLKDYHFHKVVENCIKELKQEQQ